MISVKQFSIDYGTGSNYIPTPVNKMTEVTQFVMVENLVESDGENNLSQMSPYEFEPSKG